MVFGTTYFRIAARNLQQNITTNISVYYLISPVCAHALTRISTKQMRNDRLPVGRSGFLFFVCNSEIARATRFAFCRPALCPHIS